MCRGWRVKGALMAVAPVWGIRWEINLLPSLSVTWVLSLGWNWYGGLLYSGLKTLHRNTSPALSGYKKNPGGAAKTSACALTNCSPFSCLFLNFVTPPALNKPRAWIILLCVVSSKQWFHFVKILTFNFKGLQANMQQAACCMFVST